MYDYYYTYDVLTTTIYWKNLTEKRTTLSLRVSNAYKDIASKTGYAWTIINQAFNSRALNIEVEFIDFI